MMQRFGAVDKKAIYRRGEEVQKALQPELNPEHKVWGGWVEEK
jgi:hypothetical protein